MIRKLADMPVEERPNLRGGQGVISFRHAFQPAEFTAKARLCATLLIPPGASVGKHEHVNEDELYYILSGTGLLDDGQTRTRVNPGDAILTGGGGSHAVINDGTATLEILAVIVYV
ncbi:MAG: cupin domain-containing protein [Kiritimatiellia bacterium]